MGVELIDFLTQAMVLLLLLNMSIAKDGEKENYKTAYACDGKMLKMECSDPDTHLNIGRANYGRYSIAICNEHGVSEWNVNCMSPKSLNILQGKCNQKRNCSILASTSLFNDPCPGTVKYLEVHYLCVPAALSSSTPRPAPPWLITPEPSVWSTAKSLTLIPEIVVSVTPSSTSTTKISSPSPSIQKEKEDDDWPIKSYPPVVHSTESEEVISRTTVESPPLLPVDTPDIWTPTNGKAPMCKNVTERGLYWNWTYGGDVSVQPCPGGATGYARWRCQIFSENTAIRFPDSPDLSECQSIWLKSLESRIAQGDSLSRVASELCEVTQSKTLFGGDMLITTKIMRDMAQKMSTEMLPFKYNQPQQEESLTYDLLKSVVQIGSNLLDTLQRPSWKDLSYKEQMRVATALLVGLEEMSFLLAKTVTKGKIVTHCVKNILLSVEVTEARSVSDEVFPISTYFDACPVETGNVIEIHRSSLLENSEGGLVRIVYIVFDNLEQVLQLHPSSKQHRKLNSKVISASIGRGRHIQLTRPITLHLQHLETENVTNPTCVFWDYTENTWSEDGCKLINTSETYSTCQCNHLTNFALLMDDVKPKTVFVPNQLSPNLLIISIVIIVLIILIIVTIILYFRKRTSRKEYGSFVNESLWFTKCFTCCQTRPDSEKQLNCKNARPALYGNPSSLNLAVAEGENIPVAINQLSSNTIPRSHRMNDNNIIMENHYPPQIKLNHSNYNTYGRNGSIRKIKEARRLEHIGVVEATLQHHRNNKILIPPGSSLRACSNSPRSSSHTYSEIAAGSNRSDPVYEEIEREKERFSQVSDISDEDVKRQLSDMSRQSSKSYGDHRPLISSYNAISDRNFHSALDAAFKQQLREQNARAVAVLDGQTVVCHLQQPDQRPYNNSNNRTLSHAHSPIHY